MRTNLSLASFVVLLVAGCGSSEDDVPLIRTVQDFNAARDEAQQFSEEVLTRSRRGEELTEQDRVKLKRTIPRFLGLIGFNPEMSLPYLGLAKCYLALGEYDKALPAIDQCLILTLDKNKGDKAAAAEAWYTAALCYAGKLNWKASQASCKEAVALIDIDPEYWAAYASADLQLNDQDAAREHIHKALSLDPSNLRAKGLRRLLGLR